MSTGYRKGKKELCGKILYHINVLEFLGNFLKRIRKTINLEHLANEPTLWLLYLREVEIKIYIEGSKLGNKKTKKQTKRTVNKATRHKRKTNLKKKINKQNRKMS